MFYFMQFHLIKIVKYVQTFDDLCLLWEVNIVVIVKKINYKHILEIQYHA